MKDLLKCDMESGLDHYDPEGRVFPEIANKVSAGGALTKQDVLLILKWKLGRIKDSNLQTVSDENLEMINQAVKGARTTGGGVNALKALDMIPGIGLATATAVLTVCYPAEFTIIDWRVLEMLDLFPSRMPENKRNEHNTEHWTAEDYIAEYLPRVTEQAHGWGCGLRDADRALWGLSVRNGIAGILGNSSRT
jgi:endonuclease III